MNDTMEKVHHSYRSSSRVYAFFRIRGEAEPLLHLVVRHTYPVQPWWLAVERMVFTVDGREYVLPTQADQVRSRQLIGESSMIEWFCLTVGEGERKLIRALVKAERAALRCESVSGSHERELSPAEIRFLEDVVWSWQVLGGVL